MIKKIGIGFLLLFIIVLLSYFLLFQKKYPLSIVTHSFTIGDSLDSFNDITVYNNGGIYSKSYGKHYAKDSSYYYGKKWQCVEFLKRYYYDYLHHKMPNGFGNANDFFNKKLEDNTFNKERGLIQFKNGGNHKPKINDLIVFDGKYGHVAIVSNVNDTEIEVIQQNIYMTPRQTFKLINSNGKYTIGENKKPLGWLRLKLGY